MFIQLSFTRRHFKGPTNFMPSRRDALLPSMTFFMVYIDNCFFARTYQLDLAMPHGRKQLRNKEMEETHRLTNI